MAQQGDATLGLNWPGLNNELTTDLGTAFGNMGAGNARDPFGGASFSGRGSADPWGGRGFGGSADPWGGSYFGPSGGDPFGGQDFGMFGWNMEQKMNGGRKSGDDVVAVGPGTPRGYIPGAADNSGITAQQVEAYIAKGDEGKSPLRGKGQYIIDIANKYGVSVPQMMGILQKESQFGVTAGENKNLTGIVANTDRGLGTTRQFNGYATWEESLEATAANLATPMYKGKPLEEQIGNWYVGPNAYKAQGLNATDLAGNGTVGDYVNKFIAPAFAYFGKPLTSVSTPVATGAGSDLITKARTLVGTPYQLGGYRTHRDNPRLGIDCSEYTSWIYSGTGVNLPENAQMQFNTTQRIDKSQLQPGDLVFFQGTYNVGNGDYITHVGMYVGDGKMINAQTGGVMEANLNDPYWASHYAGAGRVARPAATNSAPR